MKEDEPVRRIPRRLKYGPVSRAHVMPRPDEDVEVPNLFDRTVEAAWSELLDYRLELHVEDGASKDDVVFEQEPRRWAFVAPGTIVRVWARPGGGTGVREPRRPRGPDGHLTAE